MQTPSPRDSFGWRRPRSFFVNGKAIDCRRERKPGANASAGRCPGRLTRGDRPARSRVRCRSDPCASIFVPCRHTAVLEELAWRGLVYQYTDGRAGVLAARAACRRTSASIPRRAACTSAAWCRSWCSCTSSGRASAGGARGGRNGDDRRPERKIDRAPAAHAGDGGGEHRGDPRPARAVPRLRGRRRGAHARQRRLADAAQRWWSSCATWGSTSP